MQKARTIEHRPMPDYFGREEMIAKHGEGLSGMARCIGWTGFVGGLIAGILSLVY
jgi:hypothetical protein